MSNITNTNTTSNAIEVAAMLGDSVISVKHCADPKTGKISKRTLGMFATGTAALLASAVSFASAVHVAATNEQGLHYTTKVLHKPARAFRAQQVGVASDVVGFGGAALGIGLVGAALARARRERKNPSYRIGTAPGVELPLESAPTADFPLVAPKGDDFVFTYSPTMSGEMTTADGRTTPLSQIAGTPSTTVPGATELVIPAQAKIRATSGGTTFVVASVAKPVAQPASLFAFDKRALGYAAGSLAVHLGVLAFLQTVPVDDSSASIDLAANEGTVVRTSTIDHEDPTKEIDPTTDGGENAAGVGATEGAKMQLAEGTAGKTNATTEGRLSMKNTNQDPAVARAQAIEEARNAGILGSTRAIDDSIRAITGTVDISSGYDTVNQYGTQYGADGDGKGVFGGGRHDFGPGGGCMGPNCGVIGTGRYSTIPGGPGGNVDGPGGPGDPNHMRKHETHPPTTHMDKPTATSGLDKEIIYRYMHRHLAEFQYCYEKQLLSDSNLQGSLTVTFFIAPDGTVQSATAAGFDKTVGACVANVTMGVTFPKPSDGSGVQVNYPFSFHRSGS